MAGGGGGEDLGTLNGVVLGFCQVLNVFGITSPCPQLPTVSQAVLQVAALENAPPEVGRATNNIVMGNHIDAGNPSARPLSTRRLPRSTTSRHHQRST